MTAININTLTKPTTNQLLPTDWRLVQLRELIDISHGFPFSSEFFSMNGEFTLLTPGNFNEEGGFRSAGEKQKFFTGPIPETYVLAPKTLIVAMTEQADGLLGSSALVPEIGQHLHNQRIGRVSVKSGNTLPDYLLYLFNTASFRSKVRETAAGTKVKHTSPQKLVSIEISLPPREEQSAICLALSDINALISSLDQLIAKKRDIQQAAMQQLLTGQRRLPGFSKEWEIKRLGDIVELIMGQSPSSSNYNRHGDGLPLIQGNADIADRITIKRIFTAELTKLGKCGDILLSVRAPVGEVARASFDVCLGRGVCAIRGGSDFLYHHLISIESSWTRLSKGSTFDSINSAELRSVELRLPPSQAEQSAIATILSDMNIELTTLEARRDKARQIKQGMMQELLTGRIRLV